MAQFLQFALSRAAMAIVTLLMVSLIVFTLMELVPGTCAERYLAFKNTQGSQITVADIEAEKRRLGLDRPFLVRWGSWVGNVFFHGEFGDSCILRLNINQLLADKFWISLGHLSGGAVPGLSDRHTGRHHIGQFEERGDQQHVCDSSVISAWRLPNFLLALMIMLFSTVVFGDSLTGLFSKEFRDAPWSWAKFVDFLEHAWLPIFILGWSATAFALQTVRALMLDEIGKLYVTAAAARGVTGAPTALALSGAPRARAGDQFARLRSQPHLQRIADRRADPDADRGRRAADRGAGALQRPAACRRDHLPADRQHRVA